MQTKEILLGTTMSVCPECLKRIEAKKVSRGNQIFMTKECPEHGKFEALLWENGENLPDYQQWYQKKTPAQLTHTMTEVKDGCPFDCGICPDHRQRTCCVLLEVTQRCNLKCPVCFASAGEGAEPEDPSIEEIEEWFDLLMQQGGPFNIQLSGGEPTVRDDLEEIIALGKAKGFDFFQLNTNGIKLGRKREYAQNLKAAGLDCVFLQFDGFSKEAQLTLRGVDLLKLKLSAIKHCKDAGLSVVLVPTLAKGVNDHEIGDIIKYALEGLPAISGVHIQPVSRFGRCDLNEDNTLTIPEILKDIEEQMEGLMKVEHFKSAGAENSYCSFSGSFLYMPNGEIRPTNPQPSSCCCSCCGEQPDAQEQSIQAQRAVKKRWGSGHTQVESEEAPEPGSLDELLERVKYYTLAISCMAFMDAWNFDVERVRDCYIQVVSWDKKIVPFCAYNLTNSHGKSIYRK